jgi:hypothetical protein
MMKVPSIFCKIWNFSMRRRFSLLINTRRYLTLSYLNRLLSSLKLIPSRNGVMWLVRGRGQDSSTTKGKE